MRQACEMRGRPAHVRGRDLKTFAGGSVRKDFSGELKEVEPKNEKGATIKTLATARLREMGKVKAELKAMLPILKPSEVRRLLGFLIKEIPPDFLQLRSLEAPHYDTYVLSYPNYPSFCILFILKKYKCAIELASY